MASLAHASSPSPAPNSARELVEVLERIKAATDSIGAMLPRVADQSLPQDLRLAKTLARSLGQEDGESHRAWYTAVATAAGKLLEVFTTPKSHDVVMDRMHEMHRISRVSWAPSGR